MPKPREFLFDFIIANAPFAYGLRQTYSMPSGKHVYFHFRFCEKMVLSPNSHSEDVTNTFKRWNAIVRMLNRLPSKKRMANKLCICFGFSVSFEILKSVNCENEAHNSAVHYRIASKNILWEVASCTFEHSRGIKWRQRPCICSWSELWCRKPCWMLRRRANERRSRSCRLKMWIAEEAGDGTLNSVQKHTDILVTHPDRCKYVVFIFFVLVLW